jgi:RNA polymerase sigma-70 factor, ECF subfamily
VHVIVDEEDKASHFEALVLPHLDAAYNLAHWLMHDEHGAQDTVKLAYARAFQFCEGFRGGDPRVWLLRFVGHTCVTALHNDNHEDQRARINEPHDADAGAVSNSLFVHATDTQELILSSHDAESIVNRALRRLPQALREIIILKEMEDLSYKEIALIAGVPIAVVMSRLAHGRKLLLAYLSQCSAGDSYGLF